MAAFIELFGAKLQTKDGLKPTESVLAAKAGVMVYFSAHWCPPCRGFTPKLAEFHKKNAASKNFETVFVSSDKDQAAFDDYYKDMPWTALPYSERGLKDSLSKKCKVNGIPSLVVFGPDGKIITTDGRSEVMEHFDDAAGFPWVPPTFAEALGTEFVDSDMCKVGLEAIHGKTLGLYFSAHWCPPCRGFTPKLKEFYIEMQKKDPNFEIIFVSSDKDAAAMKSYYTEDHGSWLALPFDNRKGKDALSKLFGVEGIPTFVIVGPDGKVINTDAKGKVSAGVDKVLADGWAPPIVGDMAEGPGAAGTDINETPTLVVLCDKSTPALQTKAVEAMTPVAQKYKAEADASGDDIKYIFVIAKGGGAIDQLKALTKKDAGAEIDAAGDAPVMILFDIPDNGGFYVKTGTDVTTESISQFLAEKESGSIPRKQLGR